MVAIKNKRMKKNLIFLLALLTISCKEEKTEITIIGTMHEDTSNFTSEILFEELKQIKPDIILLEADSSDFSNDFKTIEFETLETKAALKYQSENPNVKLRPYDFEGKNKFRMDNGIGDGLSYKLLNMLNQGNHFSDEQQKLWDNFAYLTNLVDSIGYNGYLKDLSSKKTDSIVKLRKRAMNIDVIKIVNEQESFDNNTSITKTGDTITFRESSNRTAKFWTERNNAMINNILNYINTNPKSKIVVLCGFQHRYYLMSSLSEKQKELNFEIKE